jgi:hypothetical protein
MITVQNKDVFLQALQTYIDGLKRKMAAIELVEKHATLHADLLTEWVQCANALDYAQGKLTELTRSPYKFPSVSRSFWHEVFWNVYP